MFPSWWRNLVKVASRTNKFGRCAERPRPSCRPAVEAFEDRIVPTTISIPTNLTGARGAVVTAPVNVDVLNDAAHGNSGLVGADFNVFYDPTVLTVAAADVQLGTIATGGSTANGLGYSPTVPNGWTVSANASVAGQLIIGLSNNGFGIVTAAGSGSLVTINFHILSSAARGASVIDLALTNNSNATHTDVTDQYFTDYTLNPAPKNGPDPNDGAITVTGVDTPPVATNDAYSITARAVAGDPGLTVASPGVLVNDSDPDGDPITAIDVTNPAHGTLTLNADGSLVYTPTLGYLGPDSFTYQANDGTFNSNIATVNLTVTARLSIPTTLVGAQGGTVVVPVNIDNPNPPGSGGLAAATLAIDYDPAVFTVSASDVQPGTATPTTGGWQFNANVNSAAGQIAVSLSTPTADTTTSPGSLVLITFHVNASAAFGPSAINLAATNAPAGNTVTTLLDGASGPLPLRPAVTNAANDPGVDGIVTISNAQATQFSITGAPASLTAGTSATITVTALNSSNSTATNYTGTVHFTSTDGQAVLPADTTLSNGTGTFTVTLKTAGSQTITATDTMTSGITGSSTVVVNPAAAATLMVSAPATATAGNLQTVTVTAKDPFGNTATGYSGTVHFTKTDAAAAAFVPANYTFVAGDGGQHVFTGGVKLVTAGAQSITATDTITSTIKGNAAITVSAAVAQTLTVTAPTSTTAGVAFSVTVTAKDAFGNTAIGYTGTVHFTKSDAGASSAVPANYAFVASDNGVHVFTNGAILVTSGTQSVTATDTVSATLTSSVPVSVIAAAANTLTVTGLGSVTAGAASTITVTALDPFGNVAAGYTGTVHFTKTDGGAASVVPANYTFVAGDAGQHVFTAGVTLVTSGSQTVTATDTVTASITGNVVVSVSAAAAQSLTLTAQASVAVGTPFTFTVTAEDQFGNIATGYSGTIHFTKSDPGTGAMVPVNYTFAGNVGVHVFTNGATLVTVGPQTITATDTVTGSITGNAVITVTPVPATHFSVTAPGAATVGIPFTFTVTALTAANTTATSYTGTVTFTKSDPSGAVPANYTFTAADAGVHIFTNGATLVTSGSQTITATDTVTGSITGNAVITVTPVPVTHFSVTAPSTASAGQAFSITVTAEGTGNAVATGYTGTVQFTKSDASASSAVPGNYTFVTSDNGVHVFTGGVTLVTSGSQTVTATDTVTASITGNVIVSVTAAAAQSLLLTAPTSTTAGTPFTITVTAKDQFGNAATGYTGTVHFTKTDSATSAIVPANYTFNGSAGVHVFTSGVTLVTAGPQVITATDTVTGSITGNALVTITAAAAHSITVAAPGSTTAGSTFNVTVTAFDQFGNIATGYTGTVHFTKTDGGAASVVPANYAFVAGDAGQHVFTGGVTLVTAGPQTITATDTVTGTINGRAPLNVIAAAANSLTVTGLGSITAGAASTITVTALDQFGNIATGYTGTVHFTKTDSGAASVVPANYAFVAGDAGQHVFTGGVTLVTAGSQTVTATDIATGTITGNTVVSVSAAAAQSLTVTTPATANAGVPFTFTVAAKDAFSNLATGYSGVVHFTKSDAAAGSSVPANYTFVAGDGGQHVFTNGATLVSLGSQTITATDTVTASITGSATVAVSQGQTDLVVTAPATTAAGNLFTITVAAKDQFGNTITSYTGTVHFTKSDSNAGSSVPANYTFVAGDNGVHVFTNGVKLITSGTQTITATDTVTSGITGSSTITVNPGAANNLIVTAPSVTTAGSSFSVTVTARDQFGNIATSYTGTVHFTKTDSAIGSGVPNDYHFAAADNGVHVFTNGVTLITAGSQTITATDTALGSLTGQATVTVNTAAVNALIVTAPPGATSGMPITITVAAKDSFGNTVTGYTGNIFFSTTDGGAGTMVPPNYTFTASDNGVHTFTNGVVLVTQGNQTVTASDSTTPSITGTSGPITVNTGVTHLDVISSVTPTAGIPFNFTVFALDQFSNTVTNYTGTVHFASTDPVAGLPANINLINGQGIFTANFKTAGNQFLTATDTVTSSITGTDGPIPVHGGAATHFTVTAPSTVAAGHPVTLTVAGQDAFNNPTTSYFGTVHFTSSDGQAVLASNSTLSNGVGTFAATFKTVGNQTVTATDITTSSITGTSGPTAVTPGPATHLQITSPGSTVAGSAFTILVTALDQFNNQATGFTDIVSFASSDSQALVPASTTLTNGFGAFPVILKTVGTQTYTATDQSTGSINGTAAVAVSVAILNRFVVAAPSSATTGTAFSFNVTATDPFGNTVTTYLSTVHFASSDPGAVLPPDSTLTGGTGSFAAVLATPGNQTLTVTDVAIANVSGTSVIATRALIVSSFAVTPTGFVSTFNKPFNPNQLNIYDAGAADFGAPDVTLVGPSGSVRGSLLVDPSDATITFLKTGTGSAGLLTAGSYTATFRSATNAFMDQSGVLLDGNNSGNPGTNYVTTFTVVPSAKPVLSIPDFARGPDSADNIKVPNNTGTGIQITLSSAVNVTDVTFSLNYNGALLNVSGALNGPSGTFTLVSVSGGTANFTFHSATALTGTLTLGQILAQVPNSAATTYKAKDLLHLSNITVNGVANSAIGNDGVHVVAYLGDASGDGSYSPLDASLISRVATNFDNGFAAFLLIDPAIIGDLNGNGVVDSSDVSLLNTYLSGKSEPQIPPIPPGLAIVPLGVDPALSLPTDIQAIPGDTVVVPVSIDTTHPAGSTGLVEATLALRFDPQVFTVSPGDISLGTVAAAGSGWQLQAVTNSQTGEIGIDLYSTTPIQATTGGSLVTITLHVRDTAPAGTTGLSLVTQVNPTGRQVYRTEAADTQGLLTLSGAWSAVVSGVRSPESGVGKPVLLPLTSDSGLRTPDSTKASVTTGTSDPAVERVFADLGLGNAEVPAAILQPCVLETWNDADETPAGIRDLAMLPLPEVGSGLWDEWAPNQDQAAQAGEATAEDGLPRELRT